MVGSERYTFVAYPTVMVATVLVYRQLMAQTPELADFGITIPSAELGAQALPDEQEL